MPELILEELISAISNITRKELFQEVEKMFGFLS